MSVFQDLLAAVRNYAQPPITVVSYTITRPADTNAYAANDAFADSTSVAFGGGFPLTGAAGLIGGSGWIIGGVVTASAGTAYQGEIWCFDRPVTAPQDNAAFAIADAELPFLQATVPFQTNQTTSNNAVSVISGAFMPFVSLTQELRFLVKILNAPTPGNAEQLGVKLYIQRLITAPAVGWPATGA